MHEHDCVCIARFGLKFIVLFIIVILVMQNLGLGKGDLIRNLPIETRILHRENSLKQYKVATNKNITGKEIVVMI
jgi:hypothetical protein